MDILFDISIFFSNKFAIVYFFLDTLYENVIYSSNHAWKLHLLFLPIPSIRENVNLH